MSETRTKHRALRYVQAKATKCGPTAAWESDRLIVVMKSGKSHPDDPAERRGRRVIELETGDMERTGDAESVTTKCLQIAELAKRHRSLTTLAHHMDLDWMREAHRRTRKDGAVGIDGQTAGEYAERLDENLIDLLNRFKSGTYRAPAVRRTYIPKPGGERRPLGIPTFEDKVLQRAVAMVLEPIYEQDFLDCSHGFRPGRGAHCAIQSLWRQTRNMGGCWLIELDIRKFFDHLDHGCLRTILCQRIGDGVIRRMIDKWLKAGVIEDGCRKVSKKGTPQGGVISPLLANVYLHEVLDTWFEREVRPRLRGRCFLVRYADDAVLGFTTKADAERVLAVLPKRFAKFGLTLHPTKTRLIEFKPNRSSDSSDDDPRPRGPKRTFTFLGFTHYWGRSRKGRPTVKRKTAASSLTRALNAIRQWCRRCRHLPVKTQWRALCRKLQGHYAYYGITGNSRSMGLFLEETKRIWRLWLSRRSQSAYLNWPTFVGLLTRYPLPCPRVVHSTYAPRRAKQ